MKILKIRFENIHSLKGEHEIDFGEGILAEAGLFAITGPTGSGKSTLLDVITLALYNRIARMGSDVTRRVLENEGSIMTRNMRSCYAEVEYRSNGKKYRSHWSIERNRNNNLNTRKQELVEIATSTILETGTNTPKKNEEIIGLSYEQFIKAMVLAQGEFSRLLQAPRNERNKLLEDITGARSYREIGMAVYRRFSQIQNQIKLKEAGLESIELLTPEAISEKKEEEKTLEEHRPKVELEYQKIVDKINIRKELQRKEAEQKELETEKEKYLHDYKVYLPFEEELNRHNKLSKYAENLRGYDSVYKSFNDFNEQLSHLNKTETEVKTQQKALIESASILLKGQVTIDSVTEKLEIFRSKITELQSEERTRLNEAELHKRQINNLVREIEKLGYSLPLAETPSSFNDSLLTFEKVLNERLQQAGVSSLDDLDKRIEQLRILDEKAKEFLSKKKQAIELQQSFDTKSKRLKTAEEELANDTKTSAQLETDLTALNKELITLEKELEHHRKHQNLESYREQLIPNEPCPLCGSLDHPYALDTPIFDAKEELVKEKKNSQQVKSQHKITLEQKSKFQIQEIGQLKSDIKKASTEIEQLQKELQETAKQLNWTHEESLESLQNKQNELSESIQKLEQSKKEFHAQNIVKSVKDSFKQWETALTDYSNKVKQRKALYEGDDIHEKTNILSSSITKSIAQIESLEQQIKNVNEALKKTSDDKLQITKLLDNILVQEELDGLESLRKGIIPEDRANKIRKQQSLLNETKTRLSEKETTLKKALEELHQKDDKELSFDTLNTLHEESKKKRDELLVTLGKIQQSLLEDQKARERQQKVLDELELLKKDEALWKTMNGLIGDATGSKFSNFVQDLTLEQLIGYTNKRLSEFSDRYSLDIPTAEEVGNSDTLKVFDKYMGNARRSVRTLSGGETFLVSLAMAFALSDIAARNVKIESLFIDEGFGTLDPETLDQAITILEKMQNEGDRSVGIISHVDALKERITTQIHLEKGSLGYSTIEIVQ